MVGTTNHGKDGNGLQSFEEMQRDVKLPLSFQIAFASLQKEMRQLDKKWTPFVLDCPDVTPDKRKLHRIIVINCCER